MIEVSGPPLLLLAPVWALVLACLAALPPVRSRAMRLLPLAPLPALWLGIAGAEGRLVMPDVLLGVVLEIRPEGRLLLALTAGLWLGAGLYAQGYMAGTRRPAVFAGFWCLTLAGNIGVFVAADVVTFYVAFAAVSLAAYVLIVHEGTGAALRAGRVYVVMAILGEVCLIAGFMIGIAAADGLAIADIRAALPEARFGTLAVVLLMAGFGIKAGLMPLHVWLPLAHPEAPTPASAVLSGAMVKAGIMGVMLFLPEGSGIAPPLVVLGFAGAFAGALLGLTQEKPKAILAYSTVSQMSLAVALVATAVEAGAGLGQAAFYAFHHGLAKGTLFLSVGVVAACGGRWRRVALVPVALVALSVAGAPLTGGGLAKLAAKSTLEGAAVEALTLTAVTTTLVLAWFVVRLADELHRAGGAPEPFLALPTAALGACALGLPWLLAGWAGLSPGYALEPGALWSSAWPVLAGLSLAAVAWLVGLRVPRLPEGDMIALIRWRPVGGVRGMVPGWIAGAGGTSAERAIAAAGAVAALAASGAALLERRLREGRVAGMLLAVLAGAIAILRLAGG